ncbi:MAG: phosphoribosylformylglycinamidine synthase [Clostridium sp.]
MDNKIFRVYVEKKANFNIEGESLHFDLTNNLGIKSIESIRIMNRYDLCGINSNEYEVVKANILSEKVADNVYEKLSLSDDEVCFAVEFLPGQYDQRADSASQCIQILTQKEGIEVKNSRVIVLKGRVTIEELAKIKKYFINSVDSREATMEELTTMQEENIIPDDIKFVEGFNDFTEAQLEAFLKSEGFAMSLEDIKLCQGYFKKEEKRNPSETELKVIDTYWSDHCRHTTFNTVINKVDFEDGDLVERIKESYEDYLNDRKEVYVNRHKNICLMDIAVMGMKKLKKEGKLDDLDESEEINACSIVVEAEVDNKSEKWLVMFKNETHNHPTEIEPFGGASTCLGGSIRDPLSGRSFVYQAMRVTGSGDPRTSLENTLKGKLAQRRITKEAARGYSSYGNQIGLAAGQITELYHEGYVAKRMEVGAVIAAAPFENVIRKSPEEGDLIVLLGGRTGRDGCGGASGSSKEHTEASLTSCGAEVQKGNAPTERKIQRLFRNAEVTTLIKRCNDFGAGGVSVAIGELADSLSINLDLVPKKYEGLDGTEISISESQERMAVVLDKENVEKFIKFADEENLEAVVVAEVTSNGRMRMMWRGETIVDLSRDFLNTNGATQYMDVKITSPKSEGFFKKNLVEGNTMKEVFSNTLSNLNICSQKGLVEMFDSSVGRGTILMPFGGKNQLTPVEAMAAKLPVLHGETTTGTLMSYGFNPNISSWSPYHGAIYAVVESLAKIVATGGDYRKARLSFQEYFEKLGKDSEKWGKPLAALLGALTAQKEFGTAAIGGKDSMSGTFKELRVPPTLISFAVSPVHVDNVTSPEFKAVGSKVVEVRASRNTSEVVSYEELRKNFEKIHQLIKEGKVLAAHSVNKGGIVEVVGKMAFGNFIGLELEEIGRNDLMAANYGNIVLELAQNINIPEEFKGFDVRVLGETIKEEEIRVNGEVISLNELVKTFKAPLEPIFQTEYKDEKLSKVTVSEVKIENEVAMTKSPIIRVAKPKVLIPVFPGTNCEYDSRLAFEAAGAEVETLVFRNLSAKAIEESIEAMVRSIKSSQMIMIPGGFSSGDEPDGSGKFIATAFRNERIKEAVMNLLKNREGLILGVCNGFQALIKLGLVPYGEIRDLDENSPTLTNNKIGRHISCMVDTKIVNNNSPWFSECREGEINTIPVSHGEGRFYAEKDVVEQLFKNGQVATQYVDLQGKPTMDIKFNPNGSSYAIEGITSPDGRVLGKMGHSERVNSGLFKNVIGEHEQKIFLSGVKYFK